MQTRTFALVASAVLSVVVLSGCSEEPEQGDPTGALPPTGTPSSSQANTTGLPHSGAPKVANPIADTSRWEADPCSVLSADQISSLGLTPPQPQREDTPNAGVGCYWEFDSDSASGFVARFANAGARQGLSNLYKHKQLGNAKVFEELPPVDGFPAVIAMPKDHRGDGECAVSVGLRDDLLFSADMTADPSIPQGKDPCEWAAKVAALAVQTMKGSS